jgi:hypothetical protein
MAGRAPESGSSAEIAASRLNRESYAARLPANLPPQFRDVLVRKNLSNPEQPLNGCLKGNTF